MRREMKIMQKKSQAIRISQKLSLQERFVKHIKNYYQLYLMVLPAFIIVLLFHYIPLYGIQLAFREFEPTKGLTGGEFVGLEYFKKFIDSYQFTTLMKNTFVISFLTLALGFPLPILLALLINQIRHKDSKQFMQTAVYMPHFVSVIALVGMVLIFLSPSSGIIASFMKVFGLEPINFMGDPKYFRGAYVLSDIWQHTGWNSIIYLAALSSIDPQLYEAAKVDGSSRFKQILHIEIPGLVPTIIVMLILNAGKVMSVGFEKIFLMQNTTNLGVSEVISTYTYKIGVLGNQISYSTAIGLFNTLMSFALLVAVNWISKKTTQNSLW
jgi:putative aldouronate transport system permease protein